MDQRYRLPRIGTLGHRAILAALVLMMAGTLLVACSRTTTIPIETAASGGRSNTPEASRPTETPNVRRATETAQRAETPTPRPATVVAGLVAGNLAVAPVKKDCAADHPVKGRFENKQRIYYTASSRDYTHRDPDVCFATEADAQSAGFQAAAK